MAYHVQEYTQTTAAMCWEACARMMWHWRNGSLGGYEASAGAYARRNSGLIQSEMDLFYKGLGMRGLSGPRMANLTHALKHSPVIFVVANKVDGHALVATGATSKSISLMNPCALQSVDFETDAVSCQAGGGSVSNSSLSKSLGQYIWYW
jgi:hypothetical protein